MVCAKWLKEACSKMVVAVEDIEDRVQWSIQQRSSVVSELAAAQMARKELDGAKKTV
jgi:hypothetical protein